MVWSPSVALAQTPEASTAGGGTGTASAGGRTGIADLPVCGGPATTSPAPRSTSTATGDERTRAAKRRASRRERAAPGSTTAAPDAGASTGEGLVRATLTLDQEDQETVTGATFGRSTDPQPLTLVYRVGGCRVTGALPWPRSPLPTGPVKTTGARALPLGAVQIDDVEADGDRYVVYLRVFVSSGKASDQGGASKPSPAVTSASTSPAGEFGVDPGSYTSFVRIKAPWLRTVATPVTVTRSEDSEWIPFGIGVLGGLCGFFVFWLLRKIHDDDLLVKETWVLWLAAVISVVVGAGTAFVTNYFNQDVWTVDANALALFVAAFSASTGGVAAALLTGIYKTSAARAAAGGDGGSARART